MDLHCYGKLKQDFMPASNSPLILAAHDLFREPFAIYFCAPGMHRIEE